MPYSMFGSPEKKTSRPERVLSALFSYSEKNQSKRRSFLLGQEYASRAEKWILTALNVLGLSELLLGILSFFSLHLITDTLRLQNLTMAGIVLGYDLFLLIRNSIVSAKYSVQRRRAVLSVYFLKDSFVVRKEGINGVLSETEHPYAEICSLKETKHFFFLEIRGKETLFLDKSFFDTDKVELDGVRLKLIKATGLLFSLEAKIKTRDYEFALQQCEPASLKNNLLKFFAFFLFVPLYLALLLNFRSTDLASCMDLGYLFFIGGGIEIAMLVLTLVFRAKSDQLSKFFFRFDLVLTLLFSVLSFLCGGLTYTFHYSLSYDSLRKEYTSLTQEELPPSERLSIDAPSCFYKERTLDVYFKGETESHTFYESRAAGYLDTAGENDTASSFLTRIRKDTSVWKKTSSEYQKYSALIADICNAESDYFSLFVSTPNDDSIGDSFFPSVQEISDSSNVKGQECVIYFVSYQTSNNLLEIAKYNYYYSKYMLA